MRPKRSVVDGSLRVLRLARRPEQEDDESSENQGIHEQPKILVLGVHPDCIEEPSQHFASGGWTGQGCPCRIALSGPMSFVIVHP